MEIGLRKLISDGKNKEALEMLNNQNITLNSTSLRFDTGNGIVDALLAGKQQQADEINTIISFEGAVPNESIQPVDLCIIFGNPLDNAINEKCSRIKKTILSMMDEYTASYYIISSHTQKHFEGSNRIWYERLKIITLPRELVVLLHN